MHGIKGLLKDKSFRVLIGVCAVFLLLPLFFTEPPKVGYGASYHEGQLMDSFTQDTTAGNIFSRGFSNYFKRLQKFYLGKEYTPVKKKEQKGITLGDADLEGGPEIVLPEGSSEGEVRNAAGEVNIGGAAGGGASAEDYGGGFSSGGASGVMYRTQKDKNGREYIEMDDGKTFPVTKDKNGNRFVMIPGGAVPYKVFADNFVSEKEFAKAKKAAPNLSKNELLLATKSDGGIDAYLSDVKQLGRQGAFDKAQAGLEAKFNGPSGGAAGGGVSGAGGESAKGGASGSFGTGEFDGSGNSTAAGTAAAAGLSGVSSKYQQRLSNVTSEATGRKDSKSALSLDVSAFGEPKKYIMANKGYNEKDLSTIVVKGNTYETPVSEDTVKKISEDFGIPLKDAKKGSDEVKIDFILPDKFEPIFGPSQAIYETNRQFLEKSKLTEEDAKASDNEYKNTKNFVSSSLSEQGVKRQIVVISGKQNGQLLADNNSRTAEVIRGIYGEENIKSNGAIVSKDGIINTREFMESEPITVVYTEEARKSLVDQGLPAENIYVFAEDAPTPQNYNKLYDEINASEQQKYEAYKKQKAKNEEIVKQLRVPKSPNKK